MKYVDALTKGLTTVSESCDICGKHHPQYTHENLNLCSGCRLRYDYDVRVKNAVRIIKQINTAKLNNNYI